MMNSRHLGVRRFIAAFDAAEGHGKELRSKT